MYYVLSSGVNGFGEKILITLIIGECEEPPC